jgi:hypothetical protein
MVLGLTETLFKAATDAAGLTITPNVLFTLE